MKRGELAIPILNKLYKHTQLQTTFGIIFLTIVKNEPKVLNLKSVIGEFVNFRKDVVTKRSTFELNKAKERLHILEGLKKPWSISMKSSPLSRGPEHTRSQGSIDESL